MDNRRSAGLTGKAVSICHKKDEPPFHSGETAGPAPETCRPAVFPLNKKKKP